MVLPRGSNPGTTEGHGAAPNRTKTWSDADEVTLLHAAAAFRERTGRIPRNRGGATSDAGVLLCSISPHANEAKVSYTFGWLKSIFQHEGAG
ncbi:hypothetical protein GQ55_1G403300 [Panicum hallii var. hallii]|uniref:Uncharacterized protein n=1 Tax=Panicum hallii var. hallii TaxID=1504633 RepID=A0A2T7FCJ9_9POAL|nr:hypothetical protein GQ55_1G403300 [Panicum hallii var. hallii]